LVLFLKNKARRIEGPEIVPMFAQKNIRRQKRMSDDFGVSRYAILSTPKTAGGGKRKGNEKAAWGEKKNPA